MKGTVLIQAKQESGPTEKHGILVFLGVLVLTALIFSGSLRLGWTNWDDDLYVYENPSVSEANIADIFTRPADYNTYNPLVICSFVLEWKLVRDKPFLYHLDNFLLHLFCTAVVWLLLRHLGLSIWWSGFAALLFGIHPLRVESVAWITERKDVLYAFFYLAALLAYIKYLQSKKTEQLLLTFLLFILSLFSKVQAVALPFVLVLMDWYFGRKIDLKNVLGKLVFFAVSLVVGLLGATFFLKNAFVTTDNKAVINTFSSFGQMILAGYAYTVYILKSVVPYAVSVLYPMPASLRMEHWVGAAAAAAVFTGALVVWRRHRFVTFGLLFFSFNIFFLLLPFRGNESAFLNDRYVYVAYIGLFFAMAMGFQQLSNNYPAARIPAASFAIVLLFVFSALTLKYIPVWKNSESLWTHVIEKYPRQIAVAYLNRGHDRYKSSHPDQALADFDAAIEINPGLARAYVNRSVLYLEKNEMEKSLQDFNRYISLLPACDARGRILKLPLADAMRHRAEIYFRMGRYGEALADIETAIKLDPFNPDNYLNRALVYMRLGEYGKAVEDFNLCHQSDPSNADIINNRGVCYLNAGDLRSALNDFNQAIILNGRNPSYYMNRALAYRKSGRIAEARQDARTAEKIGIIDPSFGKVPPSR